MSDVPSLPSLTFREMLKKEGIKATFPDSSDFISPTSRNKRLTVYPSVITYPTDPSQVAKIVEISGRPEYRRRVVALSGGHGSIANSIGGFHGAVVINLCNLKEISFDDETKRITFQTGNRLRNVVDALKTYDRAFAHGICPDVGIGGHPAFGGFGFASRMWGLNCDAIHSMNVVTDKGTQESISAESNPDLFWAMRGAAPSFAIATSLTYDTYPAPTSAIDYKYIRVMSPQEAADSVAQFQSEVDTDAVPKELGLQFRVDKGTDSSTVALTLRGTYYGPKSTFESNIEPFLKRILGVDNTETTRISDSGLGNSPIQFPAADPETLFTNHYAVTIEGDYFKSFDRGAADVTLTGDSIDHARALNQVKETNDANLSYIQKVISPPFAPVAAASEDESPLVSFYMKTLMAPALNQRALDAFMKHAAEEGFKANSLDWYIAFKLLGGRHSVIPTQPETSFAWRGALWFIEFDADVHRPWPPSFPESGYTFLNDSVEKITKEMPLAPFGAYPGFSDDKLTDYQERYYAQNYTRLREIKRRFAGRDVFVFPQSI